MAEQYATLPQEDMKYCVTLGDDCYLFIEGVYADAEDIDLVAYCDMYAVYSGYIDLKAVDEKQLNEAVTAYYSSLEDMRKAFVGCEPEDFNRILAGVVFENDFDNCEFHGYYAKQDALDYMADWLEDREMEEIEL